MKQCAYDYSSGTAGLARIRKLARAEQRTFGPDSGRNWLSGTAAELEHFLMPLVYDIIVAYDDDLNNIEAAGQRL